MTKKDYKKFAEIFKEYKKEQRIFIKISEIEQELINIFIKDNAKFSLNKWSKYINKK